MATAKTKTTAKAPDTADTVKAETVETKVNDVDATTKVHATKTDDKTDEVKVTDTELMGEKLSKQAELAPTHSVNDETSATVEPVANSQTATKTTDTETDDEKTSKITVKVKNNGASLLETRTGTMMEGHKTTTITVADEKTKAQVLKNIDQLNYLHGNTLEVK